MNDIIKMIQESDYDLSRDDRLLIARYVLSHRNFVQFTEEENIQIFDIWNQLNKLCSE